MGGQPQGRTAGVDGPPGPAPGHHRVLSRHRARGGHRGRARRRCARIGCPSDYAEDEPPTFLSFEPGHAHLPRPDRPRSASCSCDRTGSEVALYRDVVRGPRPGETAPYRAQRGRSDAGPAELGGEHDRGDHQDATRTLRGDSHARAAGGSPGRATCSACRDGIGGVRPLDGEYALELRIAVADPSDAISRVGAVVGGSVYGILGTDTQGRDLAEGLLFGLPIALLIGIAAAIVSTAIGTGLGLLSGYKGGRTDLVIQRAADIVNNVPLLPLLIFLVFVLGSQLWLIMLVLVAFSWPGLTITGAIDGAGARREPGGGGGARARRTHPAHRAAPHPAAHPAVRVHPAHLLRARGHPRGGRAVVPGPGRSVAAHVGPGRSRRATPRARSSSATGGGWCHRACSSSSPRSRSCCWPSRWSPSSSRGSAAERERGRRVRSSACAAGSCPACAASGPHACAASRCPVGPRACAARGPHACAASHCPVGPGRRRRACADVRSHRTPRHPIARFSVPMLVSASLRGPRTRQRFGRPEHPSR